MSSPPSSPPVFDAAKTGHGAGGTNTVQPAVPRVYLRLQFEDPEGSVRDFPEGFPITVRFSPPSGLARDKHVIVGPEGRLVFPTWDKKNDFWKSFTLYFDTGPGFSSIISEPPTALNPSPPAPFTRYGSPPGLGALIASGERFFSMPSPWLMRQADWRLGSTGFAANGRLSSPPMELEHTLNDADMGSPSAFVELVLIPHWTFLRFEYFDRYFGNAHLDSPPRPALQRRISIPPVPVSVFTRDAGAASPPRAETISNWAISTSPPDSASLVQCFPLIVRRDAAGAALSPPDGSHLGLRFDTPATTHVYSESESRRHLTASPPPAFGPDRLRYYDLPTIWKSRRYYTRRLASSPPAPGKAFHTLTANEIAQAEDRAQPLVFCLDDIVLMQGDPAAGHPTVALSPPATRVAVFNHRFDDRLPNSSPQGLFKPLAPAAAPDAFDLPRSNLAVHANYIHDYPDWTRLILAQGSLFDVFDQRTPERGAHSVVGARAAVRWVDGTAAMPGISAFVRNAAGSQVPAPDNAPHPGRMLSPPVTPHTAVPRAAPLFAIQPFFQQQTPWRQRPFNNTALQMGRYDIALLRCADVREGKEIATSFNYFRQHFDFAGAGVVPSQPRYAGELSQNVADRWSGNERGWPANEPGVSTVRAELLPNVAHSPPALAIPVIWFLQSLRREQSHFTLRVAAPGPGGARDNRGSLYGTGESGPDSHRPNHSPGNASMHHWFTAAHETGHMAGLEDDYNERWNAKSYLSLSFASNVPGDPYEPDGRDDVDPWSRIDAAMMNGNKEIRNRCYWPAAQWTRHFVDNTPLRVKRGPYSAYWLRQHPHADQGRSFLTWPLANAASPPGGPPAVRRRGYQLFLYPLGADRYSQRILGGTPPKGPFDGILLVVVRIAFHLPSDPVAAAREASRRALLQNVNEAVRTTMNNRWYVDGTVHYGPSQPYALRRCLVQFVAQSVVFNHPHEISPPPAGTLTESQVAADILNRYGYDFQVIVSGAAPAVATWGAPPNQAVLDIGINFTPRQMKTLFARHFPRMVFGVDRDPTAPAGSPLAITLADIRPIAQQVIPTAVVHTL